MMFWIQLSKWIFVYRLIFTLSLNRFLFFLAAALLYHHHHYRLRWSFDNSTIIVVRRYIVVESVVWIVERTTNHQSGGTRQQMWNWIDFGSSRRDLLDWIRGGRRKLMHFEVQWLMMLQPYAWNPLRNPPVNQELDGFIDFPPFGPLFLDDPESEDSPSSMRNLLGKVVACLRCSRKGSYGYNLCSTYVAIDRLLLGATLEKVLHELLGRGIDIFSGIAFHFKCACIFTFVNGFPQIGAGVHLFYFWSRGEGMVQTNCFGAAAQQFVLTRSLQLMVLLFLFHVY